MLPPGAFLSLPQVVMAPDTTARYPNTVRISGVYGRWEDEPVSISMWHSRGESKEEGA
jgi:chemotaxis protein CheX